MENDKIKALHEAYLCVKDNLFFEHLIDFLAKKETYLANSLYNAIDWEDCCRLQGQLKIVRDIKTEIGQAASCKTEPFDSDIL